MTKRTALTKGLAYLIVGVSLAVLNGTAGAQTDVSYPDESLEPQKIYSPYVERTAVDSNFAEGVYWGDTHLHTSYSTDAGMMGNNLGPEEAYRFAWVRRSWRHTGSGCD